MAGNESYKEAERHLTQTSILGTFGDDSFSLERSIPLHHVSPSIIDLEGLPSLLSCLDNVAAPNTPVNIVSDRFSVVPRTPHRGVAYRGDQEFLEDYSTGTANNGTIPPERASPEIDPSKLLNQGEGEGMATQRIGVPDSVPFPGLCGFKVQFPEDKYSSSLNSVFLCRDAGLAAMFRFKSQEPPVDCFVRALVCVKEPSDLVKIGPCKRCLGHPAEEKDADKPSADHFLLCKNPQAMYGVHNMHKIVTLPLSGMPVNEVGPTCVYTCVCNSTCVVGRGRNKPTLILIFSLIHNGIEIGRDVVNLHSSTNPKRDQLKRAAAVGGSGQEDEAISPPTPKIPRCMDAYDYIEDERDEEGYFNFFWRGKSRMVYYCLNAVKQGNTKGPRSD